MSHFIPRGCGTALLTPFKNGKVDHPALAACVKRQVAARVHFLVPLGTTGETPTLRPEEKQEVLATVREHAAGTPLLVGVGSNAPAVTLENMQLLGDAADAFLVVVPFYNKPTQEGIYAYFKAIAEGTDKPIVIYNVPGRTGSNIQAETTLRLAEEVPQIVAVKEASGNYAQISDIIRRRPKDFSVLSGNDDETLALMATGADGVISVASNIAPKELVSLIEAFWLGNLPLARAIHHKLSPLFRACFIEPNPIPAKAAMAALGLMENELRLPLLPASEATASIIGQSMEGLWK